jgi:hypothetical protein
MLRLCAGATLSVVFGISMSACSGSQPQGPPSCPGSFYYPNVQLIYPIPGSTALPAGLTTLLYGSSPIAGLTRSTVPIQLRIGAGVRLATTGIPLPNPTPSPVATPATPDTTIAAVALPRLSAATTYQVYATQYQGGCNVPSGKTIQTNIGTFTTVATSAPM